MPSAIPKTATLLASARQLLINTLSESQTLLADLLEQQPA